MITILNGKLTIPESERFIGFAGDNLRRTIEFLIKGAKEADRIYRLYLTFDDGTVNYFVLPSKVTNEGVVLTWQVLREHIFMSGCVSAQLKAFSDTGVIYHTTTDRFFVGDSAEFSDYFEKNNTEFLSYEQRLNELVNTAQEICVLMPFIGENGNWYIYSAEAGEYLDSGKPSVGQADNMHIAQGAVTSDKLADKSVGDNHIKPGAVENVHLALGAVTGSKIADGVITAEKLASGAVTGSKIKNNSIDTEHIKIAAVSPDNLDRTYLRLNDINTVVNDSSFYNMLVANADELSEPFKKAVLFSVRPISDGITANMQKGRCFGFFVSSHEFWFTNINYNITYRVTFDENSLISLEELNTVDNVYNPESENPQSGVAVAEAINGVEPEMVLTTINSFEELFALVIDMPIFELGSRKLVNAIVRTPITDKDTKTTLPSGRYLVVGHTWENNVGCWSYGDNVLYSIQPLSYVHEETGELAFNYKVTSSTDFIVDYVGDLVGDIDTALDNIITMQESYIGGAVE